MPQYDNETEWRPVLGYEGKYEVSSDGRVRSIERVCRTAKGSRIVHSKELTLRSSNGRYFRLGLHDNGMKMFHVHVLVLEAFVGPRPEGCQTLHANGNGFDNRIENLSWGTPKDNGQDKVRHGSSGKGEKHWSKKHPYRIPRGEATYRSHLTESDVIEIRQRCSAGEPQRKIAKDFKVSQATVFHINSRKSWRHVA